MDTGQIMAVLQQMPTKVAAPQSSDSDVSVDQGDGTFAGLLQGMSHQKSDSSSIAKQVDPARNVFGALTVTEVVNDFMAALSTTTGSQEKQATPVQADSTAVKSAIVLQQDSSDPASQNVMPDLNGVQLALMLLQHHGRMPEAGVTVGSLSVGPQAMPQVGNAAAVQFDGIVPAQIRRDAPVQQNVGTVTAVDPQDCLRSDGAAIVPDQVPAIAAITAGKDSMVIQSAMNGTAVTEGDKQAALKLAEGPRSTVAIPSIPAESGERRPKVSFEQVQDSRQSVEEPRTAVVPPVVAAVKGAVPSEITSVQVRDSVRVVTEPQPQQAPLVTRSPELAVKPDVPATTPVQQTATVVADRFGTEDKVNPSEQPVLQNRVAAQSPEVAAARPIQVPSQDNEGSEIPAEQPAATGPQEQLQKIRTSPLTVSLIAADVNAAVGRLEPVRPDQLEPVKNMQNKQVTAEQIIAAVASGEKQTGSSGNDTPEQGMDGNFPFYGLHQQVKTEVSPNASAPIVALQNDTPRTTLPPEQVVQQVRDRLVNHETKPGSEQIVLRLSPEHLGELKVNLNLEGQRLKVEIVAENRMVRDSLMQHTDALKESLSRQNIKMESFEVTTGGNSTADGGRGQGDWRELAQQRQQTVWMPDGGYRLAKQAAPAIAAYQVKSEHTMLDLHF
jgi:flagellar hook-length control protein FliK